ncbi:hypothetical protein BJV82DRAFT_585579 [Fennellomyces sp. T-0311]|nr:hypothetical protein BJV82DRAFT_585579 [Fennellomyces sp. T-0311]
MGYGFFELGQASEFFMFTSPSLVWIPFFEILAVASMPRLRVERPGRFQWPIVITGIAYFWTIVMVVLSIIMAATDLPITAFILCLCMLVYFGLYIFGATISYQDARPFGWWFVLYVFLVLLNIAGSITISKLIVASLGQSVYVQLVYIILFKFMGGLSLLLLVIMFPHSWVKHIQSSKSQYKLTSSRVPADEEAPFA